MATVTHEIKHALVFIESSGGLTPHQVDIAYISDEFDNDISDCVSGCNLERLEDYFFTDGYANKEKSYNQTKAVGELFDMMGLAISKVEIIDNNANFLFKNSSSNSVSIGIIKNKLLLGSIQTFREFIFFLIDIKIILAMGFIFISMFFSIKALSFDKFSLVIPILTGVNFLVTLVVGHIFFKDELALTGYIGILFILIGIYLLGVGK